MRWPPPGCIAVVALVVVAACLHFQQQSAAAPYAAPPSVVALRGAAAPAATGGAARAGLIYLRIPKAGAADWPSWLPALEASAAANARSVTYYFAGPPANFSCANCVSMPTTLEGLLDRVEAHLGVPRSGLAARNVKHAICDLKPMWPALFPEVDHPFVGYADLDVLFGDLASEVDALGPGDDVLVPSSWYPSPLANGNFLLLRREKRDLFRSFGGWKDALAEKKYFVYDEWHGPAPEKTFMHALLEGALTGALTPRPTRRLFLQDVVGVPGQQPRNLWDKPATYSVSFDAGSLVAAYDGPCLCPLDRVPQFSIAQCAGCVQHKDAKSVVLRDAAGNNVPVKRELEVLAFHMLSTKSHVVSVDRRLPGCGAFRLANTAANKYHHSFACAPGKPG